MFARTERLMLRPAWKEDAGAIRALAETERNVRDLFGSPGSCDLASPCALDSCSHSDTFPKFLVFRRSHADPELIGVIGLEDAGRRQAELLCWIARRHRGRGYGGEAARAVLRIAKHGLRLRGLLAKTHSVGSDRFLAKLGFQDRVLELGSEDAEAVGQGRNRHAEAA
jgi:RimJ/RimL family protein N-acetyltransferase